jgi:dihydrofolate reductase
MRKVVFAINITADGYCDHTAFNPDDEVLDYFARLTRDADILLYGRKTYELMVPYWPEVASNPTGQAKGDIDFAQAFVSVRQIIVFSKTLASVEGNHTTINHGDVESEIQKFKQEQGKNILTGGVTLPSELLKLNLIDEFHLVVHPIFAGGGRHLFASLQLNEKLQLQLVGSHLFKSGCVALHYSRP